MYAGFERLKADINCMEDLLNFDKRSHLENLIGRKSLLKVNLIHFFIICFLFKVKTLVEIGNIY